MWDVYFSVNIDLSLSFDKILAENLQKILSKFLKIANFNLEKPYLQQQM